MYVCHVQNYCTAGQCPQGHCHSYLPTSPSCCAYRTLTKSGCHSCVAPSSPTVTTRSSEPGCAADKTRRQSQEEQKSKAQRRGHGEEEVADTSPPGWGSRPAAHWLMGPEWAGMLASSISPWIHTFKFPSRPTDTMCFSCPQSTRSEYTWEPEGRASIWDLEDIKEGGGLRYNGCVWLRTEILPRGPDTKMLYLSPTSTLNPSTIIEDQTCHSTPPFAFGSIHAMHTDPKDLVIIRLPQ